MLFDNLFAVLSLKTQLLKKVEFVPGPLGSVAFKLCQMNRIKGLLTVTIV